MVEEALIGIAILAVLILAVRFGHREGIHMSDYDRALNSVGQWEGFALNPAQVTLVKTSETPASYVGFALDDIHKKLMCFVGEPRLVCDYDQILEWRVLVNNRTVACLSRLSSSDLRVDDPDRDLSLDDFLRKYCFDQRQDPVLETVVIKFLIRDLSYPVHAFSMHGVDHNAGDLQENLQKTLAQIDKFKIVMYRDFS